MQQVQPQRPQPIFLSTPSARRATSCIMPQKASFLFLSTPSARRATLRFSAVIHGNDNFYPRPPRGGRRVLANICAGCFNFYPRPPRGGRRSCLPAAACQHWNFYPRPPRGGRHIILIYIVYAVYFYPRPPRGGRRRHLRDCAGDFRISIHALREEGDFLPVLPKQPIGNISILALREEGDSKNRDKISIFKQIIQHSARI